MEQFGDWLLESLIAVGGMGEVWRAQSSTAHVVALKRLHTHLARNEEARALFAAEQALSTTLPAHHNVVGGVAADAVNDRPFVALELVSGDDLRKLQISSDRVLDLAIAACDAVAHLQANGWVHGDVCPGNLVLADRLVLVDLGVARRIGAGGPMRGTHAYMAPEQVRGDAWTCATDVFALGTIVWELATDERLFHRGPPWLTMAAVMETTPKPLPDRALDAIVQRALVKDAARRTPTAAELRDQLKSLLA